MNYLIHQGALGDWVLTFPIMRALALSGGVAAVTGLAKGKLAAKMIAGVEPVNGERPEWSALFGEGGADWTSAEVRQRLAQATTIVCFLSDGRDAWAANASRLAPQARRVFIAPPPPSWRRAIGEWHLRQCQEQGLALETAVPPSAVGDGPIVIHPGSGGLRKCWPAERFEALIETLRRRGYTTRVLLGEVEFAKWPPGTLQRWTHAYQAQGSGSLDELHDALTGARLYVGNDSGPTHLAAQLGLPTIALFGPTSAKVWAPAGPQVRVLAPEKLQPMEWLGVDAVVEACERMLASSDDTGEEETGVA